jgi:hypothetical protein
MTNFSEYTISISTEPSYYGSEATQATVESFFTTITTMLSEEFPGVSTVRFSDGMKSSKTTGPDETVCDEIDRWIEANWTKAL